MDWNVLPWRWTVTNLGKVTVGGSQLNDSTYFYNLGLVETTNTAGFNMSSPSYETSRFENLSQGIYQFASDSGITGVGGTAFDNWGLVRKSAGTGNSLISVPFNNYGGSIEVDSGQLSLNGQSYAQQRRQISSPHWAALLRASLVNCSAGLQLLAVRSR